MLDCIVRGITERMQYGEGAGEDVSDTGNTISNVASDVTPRY